MIDNKPCERVVSALNGQDIKTLILAAKTVIALLERKIEAEKEQA